MMKKILIFILFILFTITLPGQETILQAYIRQGLENNLALRQKEANYEKSLAALSEARALFYPDISINARYTVARGGRIIEFPVGTLMNPVYSTLNMFLAEDRFPLIENQEFTFLREHEHETKVSVLQPLVDPKIYYNQKISKQLSDAQMADAESYRRQLVADIKTAYFNYLKTIRIEQLLDDTKVLLEENIRVNESLYRNDKVTIDNVYRSRAELSKLEQQIAEITRARQVAAAYFNFLLNRPLDELIMEQNDFDSLMVIVDLPGAHQNALANREELSMLESYARANDYFLSLNHVKKLPSVYGAVDYGFQGEDYVFTAKYDYVIASVVLRWDLFHGFKNKASISQARIERDIRQTQIEEAKEQIGLQVIQAYYDLQASEKSIIAAEEELASATKAWEVIDRKFREGQANLIEYIDARTTMTNAGQNLIISRYDHHIKYAEFERVACLY
jgi:outer membrane protein